MTTAEDLAAGVVTGTSSQEMVHVLIESATVGIASCEGCEFHIDALEASDVPRMQSDSAMHAISAGHTVNEFISRTLTVRPVS